jgi:uncharacterized membrane protein
VKAQWSTGRTEAFSDGVLAIAITILVLELSVPHEDFTNLWRGILEQWPSYLAYATSFLTIGGIWLSHHSLFGRLQALDRRIMQLNLLLLMVVSFLPFPTKLMAEAIHDPDAERAAVIFYGVVLLVISTLVAALWGTVARSPELLEPDVEKAEIDRIAEASAPHVGFYAVVTLIAIVAPQIAAFGFLLIAVALVVTARGEDPETLERESPPRGPRRQRRRRRGSEASDS